MQAEYINSFNHNYIKVKNKMELDKKLRYQYQILTTRKLAGLLPVNMHVANGECGLYYEISSKQSLPKWFLKEKIGREWMEKFILSLQTVLWSMEQYLMDNRNLILNPEYIFQDMETEKIFFLYMPYFVETEKNDISVFLSFLIENVDTVEENTVTVLYDIFSKWEVMQEQFTIETFLQLWKSGMENICSSQTEEGRKETASELPTASMVFTTAKVPTAATASTEEDEDIYIKKRDLGEFFFGKSRKMKVAETVKGFLDNPTEGIEEKKSAIAEEIQQKTTYMEIKQEEQERKLYGNGKQNRRVISLIKLPIVIGKKGEKVDVTLSDASISRMHARLTEEEGQVYLEDLNATNGTFKNGVRLKPYERVELDREDEVKLGKMSFTYR